jgi:hypothetical protein
VPASSLTVNAAWSVPASVGVKVTAIVQNSRGASGEGQALAAEKLEASIPVVAMDVIFSGSEPVLSSVTDAELLEELTVVESKMTAGGSTSAACC